MDHGRFEYGRQSSRGNSAGRTTNAFLIICSGGGNENFQRAIEVRHSPHGSMGAGLPWGLFRRYCHGDHGRQPGPARRLVGCASGFFRKAAGMSPISCLVGMALHSWWHRDAIAAAHSQRGRHDHRAGQLQHLFATSQIVYGPVWSALLMAAPLPSRCLMAKPPIRCAYRIGRQAQTVPPSRYSL